MPVCTIHRPPPGVYERHRPEETVLYEVVRDNLETLYGAIDDGGLQVRTRASRSKRQLSCLP